MDGLVRMLDIEDKPEKIIAQFKAVDRALDTVYDILLDEVFRKSQALKIAEVAEACPGNCGNVDKIEYIKIQLPNL